MKKSKGDWMCRMLLGFSWDFLRHAIDNGMLLMFSHVVGGLDQRTSEMILGTMLSDFVDTHCWRNDRRNIRGVKTKVDFFVQAASQPS